MKREILYRGKCKETGKWVEGYYYAECGCYYIIKNCQIKSEIMRNIPYKIIPETVGQYTGLKDRNGKMVFEGDIVSYNDPIFCSADPSQVHIGTVEWKQGGFIVMRKKITGTFPAVHNIPEEKYEKIVNEFGERLNQNDKYEVIGNIHDNRNLLEVKHA